MFDILISVSTVLLVVCACVTKGLNSYQSIVMMLLLQIITEPLVNQPTSHTSRLNNAINFAVYLCQVRVSMMKKGTEQAFIDFNGRGSDFDSWFSKDRVTNSTWTDLTSQPTLHFSMRG